MKGDCKVQTLALEIITPLNECTGRLSRVSTRHKHNRRGMQKKVREKSRECHNHKPQPFPDPKRKRQGMSCSAREGLNYFHKNAKLKSNWQ